MNRLWTFPSANLLPNTLVPILTILLTLHNLYNGICIKLLKPTGYVTHQQFNIQQSYALPTLYLRVFIYLRTNSDLCHLQHKLIGFYNRDEKCLLRGTN